MDDSEKEGGRERERENLRDKSIASASMRMDNSISYSMNNNENNNRAIARKTAGESNESKRCMLNRIRITFKIFKCVYCATAWWTITFGPLQIHKNRKQNVFSRQACEQNGRAFGVSLPRSYGRRAQYKTNACCCTSAHSEIHDRMCLCDCGVTVIIRRKRTPCAWVLVCWYECDPRLLYCYVQYTLHEQNY